MFIAIGSTQVANKKLLTFTINQPVTDLVRKAASNQRLTDLQEH